MLGAPLDGVAPTEETLDERLALIGGTSTCHMAVSREPRFIQGIWGPYFSAMIPGMWLTEGGQSATGALIDHVIDSHARGAELSLEAKRLEGVDFFCGLTFPVGSVKTCATLVCGGWGGAVTGISNIDNLDASENSTSNFVRYEDNKWYAVKVRVTPENLSVWIDAKHLIDQDLKDKKVNVRPGPIESYLPLSFTTYATTAAIRNVKLKVLEEPKKTP